MNRTTLADSVGTVHAVSVPVIPADYPSAGGVTIKSLCGIRSDLPATLARQTAHPAFVGRTVTCPVCLSA